MSIPRAFIEASVALALASVTVFTASAFGQSPKPHQTVRPSFRNPNQAVRRRRSQPRVRKPKDLESEIEAVKAENAVVRELLRKMAEQQRILLEQVDRLQRRLDGGPAVNVSAAPDVSDVGQPISLPTPADFAVPTPSAALNIPPSATDSKSTSVEAASVAPPQATTIAIEMEWSSGKLRRTPRCRSC